MKTCLMCDVETEKDGGFCSSYCELMLEFTDFGTTFVQNAQWIYDKMIDMERIDEKENTFDCMRTTITRELKEMDKSNWKYIAKFVTRCMYDGIVDRHETIDVIIELSRILFEIVDENKHDEVFRCDVAYACDHDEDSNVMRFQNAFFSMLNKQV